MAGASPSSVTLLNSGKEFVGSLLYPIMKCDFESLQDVPMDAPARDSRLAAQRIDPGLPTAGVGFLLCLVQIEDQMINETSNRASWIMPTVRPRLDLKASKSRLPIVETRVCPSSALALIGQLQRMPSRVDHLQPPIFKVVNESSPWTAN
jgi:hypothetical protein